MDKNDLNKLREIVGYDNVSDDECELIAYGIDADLLVEVKPVAVVRPGSAEEVSELIKFANQREIPITFWGGGTNVVGAHTSKKAILLDLTRLNKILEIDEESMTVTTQAGITWGKLVFELEKEGWTTGPFLHSGTAASVGGSVALCGNAITAAKYGLVGNQVVGLQVVLPNGKILRTGSGANPRAKNFYRYAWASDLTGLFIGSHGIFGVITEVTLKLYPLPEEKGFAGYVFKNLDSGTRALYEIQKRRIPITAAYLKLGINDPSYKPEESILSPISVEGTKEGKRQIRENKTDM
ncbi:FAD-binding oxidoreductase [Candidatus Aerophobetes bacterium]|nr:FAD-binding oxidoreductase [Candidatus Aerophobetes bacterium]